MTMMLTMTMTTMMMVGMVKGRVLVISEWDVLGPFPVGKTEVDGDVLEAHGGLRAVRMEETRDGSRRVADRATKYFSEVARGGTTSWNIVRADSQGRIGVNWGVDWNQHVQWMEHNMMVLETQSYFLGSLVVPPGEGGTYLVHALGVHSFTVDRVLCHGDIYSRGELLTPLELAEGAHEVLVRFRARAQGSFSFRAQPAGPPLQLTQPNFSPDLSDGLLLGEWLPLPVLNAGTGWLDDLRVESSEDGLALHPDYMQPRDSLAPGVLLPIPVRIKLKPDAEGKDRTPGDRCLEISFTVSGSNSNGKRVHSAPMQVSLRCRKHDEAFLFGFLDHDGSVAHAAAIPPRTIPGPGEGVGVMLSFSGVGVTPQKQAESHKYMPKNAKEFAFGYKNMWTLAPERDGAHNWEGVGSRTATTALDALTHVSAQTPYPVIHSDRVHVTGHSRGGHGALVFGVNRPDRAISVSSLSGWYKREYYGDANPLFVLDLQLSHMAPQLKQLLVSSIIEHDCGMLMSNLLHTPLLERVGSADSTISPWYTRRMARVMTEHYGLLLEGDDINGRVATNVSLNEIKKDANGEAAGHWWWDTKVTNDGGVINDEMMRKFLAKAIKAEDKAFGILREITAAAEVASTEADKLEDERDEMGGDTNPVKSDALASVVASYANALPTFTLSVANPATQHGRYGLRVLQQRHTMRSAQLRVRPAEARGVWAIETRNVRRFSLRCGKHGGGDGGLVAQATLGLHGLVIDGFGDQAASTAAPFDAPLSAGCKHYCLVEPGSTSSGSGGDGSANRWEDCTESQFTYKRRERSPLTYGPARQVFMAPFVIIVGTGGATAADNTGMLEIGRYISNSHYAAVQSYAPVLLDTDVADWGQEDRNMVLIGRPSLNAASRWLQQQAAVEKRISAPPVTFLPNGYRIGSCVHTAVGTDNDAHTGGDGGLALGFVTPLPSTAIRFSYSVGGAEAGRLALMLDGIGLAALRSLVKFSFSSNQALTRAAFTNLWPDYMLVGADYGARGYGGVLEAGFWCVKT